MLVRPHRRRQPVKNELLGDRRKLRVAMQAQGERSGGGRQVQPARDLGQLRQRAQRVHIAAVFDCAPLEQFAVRGRA